MGRCNIIRERRNFMRILVLENNELIERDIREFAKNSWWID